jgi:hypothetical protein
MVHVSRVSRAVPRLPFTAVLAMVLLALGAPKARAQVQTWRPAPLYVLTIQTDDADDQAEGLTEALRAHLRTLPGWVIGETTQSFETLAIALRCPRVPDGACLERIADQIHADHFLWGTLSRGQRGEVSAELHLWQRGAEGKAASAAYSDQLKDANDPRLRAIAKSLLEKLTEAHAMGTIVVQAAGQDADVFVDDVARGSLQDGTARVVVNEGTHTVELRGPNIRKTTRSVTAVGGSDVTVVFASLASPVALPARIAPEPRPSAVQPVLGVTAIAVGAGLLVAAGVEALGWQKDKNDSDQDRTSVPNTVQDVCSFNSAAAADACNKAHDAKTVSTLGWVFAGAGAVFVGTGITLVVTAPHEHGERDDHDGRADARSRARSGSSLPFELLPAIGPQVRSLDLRVRF